MGPSWLVKETMTLYWITLQNCVKDSGSRGQSQRMQV